MRIFSLLLFFLAFTQMIAQPYQITFTGSGMSNTVSTVEVQNLTQNTVLTLNGTDILELVTNIGISDGSLTKGDLMIYPNPAASSCRMEFYNSRSGEVKIELFDVTGKLLLQNENNLPQGIHGYDLAGLKTGMYVVKVSTPANSNSAQIISTEMTARQPLLKYAGISSQPFQKAKLSALTNVIQMQYNAGEMLLFKGTSGIYSRVITLLPTQNQNVDFEFIDCTDSEGNHYPVVTIGTQTWMAENLKTTKNNNSSAIPLVTDNGVWTNLSTPAYCWYENDSSTYGSVYGALYNWFAVETGNLCPTGWHVPTDAEWTILIDFLGGESVAGGPLKETGTSHWKSPNTGATNSSGFTALPGGYRYYSIGNFSGLGNVGTWWSSTAYSSTYAWSRGLYYSSSNVYRDDYSKRTGFSVRCVMDTGISASMPTLTTDTPTSITSSTAVSGGNVTSDGGAAVTARGVCWSNSPNPTISNNTTSDGTGTGNYTSNITGLNQSTTYYVRAYATNSVGTAYGNQQTFTTQAATVTTPTVTTTSITGVTQSTATSGGNVTSQGGASVTARGVCWSTSPSPTTANNTTSNGTGTGSFTSNITGLSASTTYYVRAYAINSGGTAYGSQQTFTTQAATVTPPTVTTTSITGVTQSTATSGGNVTSQGGAVVTARGVCYSTSPSPTIANNTTSNGTGTGSFTSNITGLSPSTTYYVRAYAANSGGTAYGNELNFTTSSPMGIPCPGMPMMTDYNGNIYNTVQIGTQCWMKENLKARNYKNGTTIPEITSITTWYNNSTGARCWYKNDSFYYAATYGALYNWYAVVNSNGLCPAGWHVPTDAEWTILENFLGGDSIAGGSLKETGTIHWNIPNTGATNSSGFNALPGGLREGIQYSGWFGGIWNSGFWWSSSAYSTENARHRSLEYNAIWVINWWSISKKYGLSVRCVRDPGMSASIPILTTDTLTFITSSTAVSGGNVTSDGGVPVTARGVCWSTSPNPTIANNTTSNGTGTGTYISNITGLSPSTTYYVRAYATNSAGTAYGNQQTFTTQAASFTLPTVTTNSIAGVTQSTAISGGNVSSQGSAAVTARGVCWSTNPNPTIANNNTSDGTGTGTFTSSITGLDPSTSYYVRAYATNSIGTTYGNELNFVTTSSATGVPCPGMPTITDYNGNIYNTVQIGTQCWMKENLKARNFKNGTTIPEVMSFPIWVSLSTGARSWYNNDSASYAATYGALYNWYAVTNTNGLCPTGWHVPTDAEWTILTAFLGGDSIAGGSLKETGTGLWNSPNAGTTNSSGFTALPGGYRNFADANFCDIGSSGSWWSSTAISTTNAWDRRLFYNSSNVSRGSRSKEGGFSVRCVRD
jgi:uncharacterized protein (TIGR02145 family)